MIVRHSLADLWAMDLHGKLVGVVEDSDSFAVQYDQMGLAPGVRFNSGVMLCDLHAMRQLPLWELYQQALDRFGDRLLAGDQDLLNHVMADKTMIISCKWNNATSVYREIVVYKCYDQKQVREAMSDPVIVHFTGRRKPWQFKRDRHPYAREYWQYLAYTPWRNRRWRGWAKQLVMGCKVQTDSTYQQCLKHK
jgi:lipopolysaccharide biosynthesis glycosyltransferase